MTDLEATKLCAEAMGWTAEEWSHLLPKPSPCGVAAFQRAGRAFNFDPLHDDAQSMALVQHFRLRIKSLKDVLWEASTDPREDLVQDYVHADLNRCIVFCVAAHRAVTSKGNQSP